MGWRVVSGDTASTETVDNKQILAYRIDYEEDESIYENMSTESIGRSNDAQQNRSGRTHETVQSMEFLAPIEAPQKRVLDITRVLAEVTGTDLSPIQPVDGSPNAQVTVIEDCPARLDVVPENHKFDFEDSLRACTWPVPDFDLIHIQGIYGLAPDWIHL
ncbi:hypothetical protein CEK25_006557 [Fusarium fujikuroi]|nr:hypothetical protein CEK25_006557 [Fusarium fujikuroi]